MSRKLTIGAQTAHYSYNRARHCIDARMILKGEVRQISGSSLGEVKTKLLVLAGHLGVNVYTLMPTRSE